MAEFCYIMAEKMYSTMTKYTIMILGRMNNRGRSDAAFSSSLPLKKLWHPSHSSDVTLPIIYCMQRVGNQRIFELLIVW